jgi:hypothetical protein
VLFYSIRSEYRNVSPHALSMCPLYTTQATSRPCVHSLSIGSLILPNTHLYVPFNMTSCSAPVLASCFVFEIVMYPAHVP